MAMNLAWLQRHRAVVGAAVCTLVMALCAFMHWLQPGRCLLAVGFCWMLALHSEDVNAHAAEIARGFQALEEAGIDYRTGKPKQCAEDLSQAAAVGAQVVSEVRAEEAAKQAAQQKTARDGVI